jgi:arylsulfatase
MKHKLKYYGFSPLTAAAAMFVALPAPAQQITGTPGSPSATTTISGKQLSASPGEARRRD